MVQLDEERSEEIAEISQNLIWLRTNEVDNDVQNIRSFYDLDDKLEGTITSLLQDADHTIKPTNDTEVRAVFSTLLFYLFRAYTQEANDNYRRDQREKEDYETLRGKFTFSLWINFVFFIPIMYFLFTQIKNQIN